MLRPPIILLAVARINLCLNVCHHELLQIEADLLKKTAIGAVKTKVIALGIGSGISRNELVYIASAPESKYVILVRDHSALSEVESQLSDASCSGQ